MASSAEVRRCGTLAAVLLGVVTAVTSVTGAARAARYPAGFTETVVLDGLQQPTHAAFAPDGRIVVAEKRGVVKIFDGPGDASPDLLVDLSLAVHDYWDRGMLGLAVDPGFPARPWIYVLYTHNFDPADPDAGEPRWPTNGCPANPGPTTDGCVVNGRLSRVEVGPGNTMIGGEQVLLEGGWCAQFPSHSVGALAFDAAGALYVTAGDGASAHGVDWGQFGGSSDSPVPANPCDDPPGGRGTALTRPDAEGGALRAQDLRTDGDPVGWSGSVLRVDPDTGAAWPTNPRVGGDPADDRVVAYGLRNPFRVVRRPGTDELWIGDVGWQSREEIDRLVVPVTGAVPNFGWPCYEGAERQPGYDDADLTLCESLYADAQDPAVPPYFAYRRGEHVDPEPDASSCSRYGGSAISGLAFAAGGGWPAGYDGALFFADFPRQCIFVMHAGADGLPDPATRATFADGVPAPVQLLAGPDGALHVLTLAHGRLLRIDWNDTNTPPVARASADVTAGSLPLTVQFDAASSSDADPNATLTYAWDLDGDGAFDDSSLVAPTFTYDLQGEHVIGLHVTDEHGASGVDTLVVTAGNTPPLVTITAPEPGQTWRAGQEIAFAGTATDAESGALPAAALRWEVVLHVCGDATGPCTPHTLAELDGVATGSFAAPDRPGRSWLELVLRASDGGFASGGGVLSGTAARELQPETVELTFATRPGGLDLSVDGALRATPFTYTTVVGATSQIGAPDPQPAPRGVHRFVAWSDGGAAVHGVAAPPVPARLEAQYVFDCLDAGCTPVLRVSPDGRSYAPYTSVQEAVDGVAHGSRVEVFPGTYAENVVVDRGIAVTLAARDDGGGGAVTIDGGTGTAVDVSGSGVVSLRGLTLTGAAGLRASGPTRLDDLHVAANGGTALELTGAAHDVRGLVVAPGAEVGIAVGPDAMLELARAHVAGAGGTALAVAGTARVRNLLAHDNGTAIHVARDATLDLGWATIVDNAGAGLTVQPSGLDGSGASVAVTASVLWANAAGDAPGVPCSMFAWTDSGHIACAGTNGNFAAAPRLDADYRPAADSPLVEAGPVAAGRADDPCVDLAGDLRWRDHDGDGVPRADVGAFEREAPAARPALPDLRFATASDLRWTAPEWAVEHHVYRGTRADAAAAAGLPCVDGLDADRTDAAFHDDATPAPHETFLYLVTAEDAAGVRSDALPRTCAERTLSPPCP